MRSTTLAAALALALASTAFVATGKVEAQGTKSKCVLAGGEATMVTGDLARFMANAALKNSISGMGAKASGPVKMTCKDGVATVHCLAQQRACK